MTDTRQYVAVKYRSADKIEYTYHNDGEPVAVGDEVKIPTQNDGWTRASVSAVGVDRPKFKTKPIAGLAPNKEVKDA